MWGRLYILTILYRYQRFTPTHVGKMKSIISIISSLTVHPHACGEDKSRQLSFESAYRFTPTHVGKIGRISSIGLLLSVHPHACGEDIYMLFPFLELFGSPPRMWGRCGISKELPYFARFTPTHVGKILVLLCDILSTRFTPTHVGKINLLPFSKPIMTVHPHACGEDYKFDYSNKYRIGSPPRMWGRLGTKFGIMGFLRFTPTHVGKMKHIQKFYQPSAVHPHACGEDFVLYFIIINGYGSPPRMWGRF